MNPKLIKFAVELQNCDEKIEENHKVYLMKNKNDFLLNFFNSRRVSIPIKSAD